MKKIKEIQADLNKRFRQREEVIECMLACLLAGELMLLLGPRGEAKTAIVEALADYIQDGEHFSVGLAKSSTPDDILGGVDVVALQNGVYQRNVQGFLPTATTFLLDEGFKSNNPTLQALLRVLSERSFQGQPTRTLFGAIASNELPPELRGQKKGKPADLGPFEDSLLAFFDRFFHKLEVEPLGAATSDWQDVVFGDVTDAQCKTRITIAEIKKLQDKVDLVTVPERTKELILRVSQELLSAEVHVSTRTWRKAIRVLKAHALLDGRNEVKGKDLRWLEFAFWTTPDQRSMIKEVMLTTGSPEVAEARAIEAKVAELVNAYNGRKLELNQDRRLQVSNVPVSALAHASVQEIFSSWLKAELDAVEGLDPAGDEDDEIAQVARFIDLQRKRVLRDLMKRLNDA